MASRKLPNWLQAYAEFTQGTESPEIFHLWVALGTLAGAAQRKIVMDLGYFHVHTNMFIVLVSPPGRSRKSTALRIGKSILKDVPLYGVDLFFSTQASSVAALVKQMAAINEKNKDHQSLTAFSSELGSLLGTKSVEMTDFLVDIYDCEPDWDKQTVGRGLEKIDRPWLNLVGATTPQWMGDNLSSTAIEGGFVSRTVFVFDDTRKRVAFPSLSEHQKGLRKALVHDLAHIAKLKGTATLSDEATEYYTHWYEKISDSKDIDYRIAGFYERKHIHVFKVAMALSLAENDSLVIERRDVETAIAMLDELEIGMKRAFSAVGKNAYSTDIERIKSQIWDNGTKNGGLHYKQLLAANIHSIEKDQLDKIIQALVSMGEIVGTKHFRFVPNQEGINGSVRNGNGSGIITRPTYADTKPRRRPGGTRVNLSRAVTIPAPAGSQEVDRPEPAGGDSAGQGAS